MINRLWLACLTLLGGAMSCGIFYALSIGSPREAFFLQVCSVGVGIFVSAALGVALLGDFSGERKTMRLLLLPLVFGLVSTGVFYALIYGSPHLAQLMGLAGISNGAGLVVALLTTVLLRRSAPVQVALAEEAVAFDGSVRVLDLTDKKSSEGWNPFQEPNAKEIIENLTSASNPAECDPKQDAAEALDKKDFQNKEDDSLMTGYCDNTVALEQLEGTDVDEVQTLRALAHYQAENHNREVVEQAEKGAAEQNASPENSEKVAKQASGQEVRLDPRGILDLVKTLVNSVEQIDQKMLEDIAEKASRISALAEEYREHKTRIEEQLTVIEKSVVEADKKVEEMMRIAEEMRALAERRNYGCYQQ